VRWQKLQASVVFFGNASLEGDNMTKKNGVPPVADPQADTKAGKVTSPEKPDQGLAERRKLIRPLPTPEAVESEGDTDWALFQALSANESEPKK
jgi:hypothetical protein